MNSTLAYWPRYAEQPSTTLANRPRYANNLSDKLEAACKEQVGVPLLPRL
ncbi:MULTISPECIES: hypothetical protein [Moorena]|nr:MULTISPECIES: hypothetical protein [Moorena]NEP70114.1 hypothetical protein [Moorena sp. SIO3A5]NEQ07691.1 hypothetical protein [Moorena sp. SIO4E2]NES45322.1 hypothetical protein [Moorena sp. SIO2C4]NES83932.1 hypothetical protein [Moorena sp. SIO2B7]